jgi:hypothetical protein
MVFYVLELVGRKYYAGCRIHFRPMLRFVAPLRPNRFLVAS